MVALILNLAGLLIVYLETLTSIVSIWLRPDTYSHYVFAFSISAYLIWRNHDELANIRSFPSVAGLALLTVLTISWTVSSISDVTMWQHFGTGAMVPALVVILFGSSVAQRIAVSSN